MKSRFFIQLLLLAWIILPISLLGGLANKTPQISSCETKQTHEIALPKLDNKQKTYLCPSQLCPKTFACTGSQEYIDHLATHGYLDKSLLKTPALNNDQCKEVSLPSKSHPKNFLLMNLEVCPYACKTQPLSESNESNLLKGYYWRKHLQEAHKFSFDDHQCPICKISGKYSFTYKPNSMREHLARHHNSEASSKLFTDKYPQSKEAIQNKSQSKKRKRTEKTKKSKIEKSLKHSEQNNSPLIAPSSSSSDSILPSTHQQSLPITSSNISAAALLPQATSTVTPQETQESTDWLDEVDFNSLPRLPMSPTSIEIAAKLSLLK